MRGFAKIRDETSPSIQIIRAQVERTMSEKLIKIFSCKLLNHKITAFYAILARSAKNQKMKKYDLAEIDVNEAVDEELSGKVKEL